MEKRFRIDNDSMLFLRQWLTYRYYMTNSSIVKERHFLRLFSMNEKDVPLSKISNVELVNTFGDILHGLFGEKTRTLDIITTDPDLKTIRIFGVKEETAREKAREVSGEINRRKIII